jgi:hypothetical protein
VGRYFFSAIPNILLRLYTVLLWRTFKPFCHLFFFRKCVHVKNHGLHTAGSTLILQTGFLKNLNKYLQFSVYFFIKFTFSPLWFPRWSKWIPLFFIISGLVSLWSTLVLIRFYLQVKAQVQEHRIKKTEQYYPFYLYITINVFISILFHQCR